MRPRNAAFTVADMHVMIHQDSCERRLELHKKVTQELLLILLAILYHLHNKV
jgi:hypothetical protein